MNIRKIFTIVSIFGAFAANAQITLVKSSINTPSTAIEKLQPVQTSSIKIPQKGVNMQWDYSGAINIKGSGSIDSISYMAPIDTVFHATRAYPLITSLSNISIKSNIYQTNDIYGYGYIGYSVDTKQNFSINGATGGGYDSIVVPVQDSVYSKIDSIREFILKYPATYNSNWSFSGNLNIHFLLDIPSLGAAYVNLYSTRRITRTVTDSVVGWGTLQVPVMGSVRASQPYYVLLVKEDARDIVNYAVNGLPATILSTVLTALKLKQNDTATTSTYIFYRSGYANPLMAYEVDPSAGYDPNNTVEMGIEDENAIINFEAYPNPVTQSNINFVFNKPDSREWLMVITNETGQIVQSLPVNQHAGPVQLEVNLPSTLANGIYFYNMNDGGNSAAQGKFIINR